MATVLQEGGFDFRIYKNDHTPSHVHVFSGKAQLVVNIGDENTKPVVRENRGVKRKADFAKILRMVADNQDFLLKKWREIHGQE